MDEPQRKDFLANTNRTNPIIIVSILLLINFLLRIFIWSNTELFRFADFAVYLEGIEKLVRGEQQYLLEGNFLFAISFIGYFCENLLGSLDYFFVFNCLVASLTGLILYFLVVKVTGITLAGIITVVIQTLYTEYMVFSSVFYTPVIMIFFLSLFLLLLYFYMTGRKNIVLISSAVGMLLIFLLTFFFKPELQYLPWFLIVFSLLFIRSNKELFYKVSGLAIAMIFALMIFNRCNIISHPDNNVISNSFIFFGHTDYGGDGGEGSFVYPENKIRYDKALADWCEKNNITQPDGKDINKFRREEIIKFVTGSPFRWIKLQFKKIFRTFGIVPESASFKVLYTGLLKGNLWLTSIIVVAPIALIIILFIFLFNFSALKKLLIYPNKKLLDLQDCKTARPQDISINHFLYIYCLLFFYYLIASVFFGQYQERYRMPMMVVFIIPVLSYFIATFNKKQFFNKTSLSIKLVVIIMFLVIWVFQAKKAISNKDRLRNAIESVE